MEERFDKLEQMIGSLTARFDSVDQRFDEVDRQFKDVGNTLVEMNQRIGVLHEDVKSDIRFGLEARQALQEVMEAGFANQERSFGEALAPIADAVRANNRK
jgi:tetrahydromethanopterin S-methyltransferase subunit G